MFISKYTINVLDKVWNEKTQKHSKEKQIVASVKDDTGICSKHFGKFLDDLSENNYTFQHGEVEVVVTIKKGDE